jgi:hypothetical protein
LNSGLQCSTASMLASCFTWCPSMDRLRCGGRCSDGGVGQGSGASADRRVDQRSHRIGVLTQRTDMAQVQSGCMEERRKATAAAEWVDRGRMGKVGRSTQRISNCRSNPSISPISSARLLRLVELLTLTTTSLLLIATGHAHTATTTTPLTHRN